MLATDLARTRVPLGFVCGAIVLWLAQPTPGSLTIGGFIAIGGEIIRIWAAGHLEKGKEVTRSGPYRLTRHPLYMGSAIIALGAAIASARLSVAVIILMYVAVTLAAAIVHEERSMRAAFGDQYNAYANSRTQPVDRSFSWKRALKNKEHKAVVGLAVAAAVLAAKTMSTFPRL